MALVDEMRVLRGDIDSGKKVRKRRLEEIKEDLSVFMRDSSQKRKEDFEALTKEVSSFLADLKSDVKAKAKKNRGEQREVKKMLADASAAFWGGQK
ncbi:hypothetical protein KKB40_06495 [Patescibacteria group bacterium]|nr:hypothetical protein [Patescibacteria group bacterium]